MSGSYRWFICWPEDVQALDVFGNGGRMQKKKIERFKRLLRSYNDAHYELCFIETKIDDQEIKEIKKIFNNHRNLLIGFVEDLLANPLDEDTLDDQLHNFVYGDAAGSVADGDLISIAAHLLQSRKEYLDARRAGSPAGASD